MADTFDSFVRFAAVWGGALSTGLGALALRDRFINVVRVEAKHIFETIGSGSSVRAAYFVRISVVNRTPQTMGVLDLSLRVPGRTDEIRLPGDHSVKEFQWSLPAEIGPWKRRQFFVPTSFFEKEAPDGKVTVRMTPEAGRVVTKRFSWKKKP